MNHKICYVLILFYCVTISELFSQSKHIKIIETSDVHGAIFPYDLIRDKPTTASLAQVLTYVNTHRADSSQLVILIDNGDILQGTPVVYYYNFEKSDSLHLLADVMNYIGYDIGTVGNHDIEAGHEVYDKFRAEINFPWIAANAINAKTGEPYFKPYHMIKKDGISIAVLGLITPSIPNWLPERLYSGIQFDDMIETADKWVPIIRSQEQPDILIGLFHSGVDYTYGGVDENTFKNENASRLVAEKVPGFDIVFVGHDHSGWNFVTQNNNGDEVLILGTTSGARNVAVADIILNYDTTDTPGIEKQIIGSLINMKDYIPDPDFMNYFYPQFEEVKQYVNRPIAEFTSTISSRDALFGPSAFVDLIHTIQSDLTGADISFTAPLSFNATIQEGTIYVRDLFELYSYENQLYTMQLTGEEIKNYLEFSYGQWMNQMKSPSDHLLRFKKDEAGEIQYSARTRTPELETRYYNFESAAGIDYVVDITKPVGDRIKIQSLSNGKPFLPDHTYTIAVNSYRANGGGGHMVYGAQIPVEELNDRVLTSSDKDLRYYLMKWFEKEKTVQPVQSDNWKVIPEDYWNAGKERDFHLLFPTKL